MHLLYYIYSMGNASASKNSDQIDKSEWQTNGLFIEQKKVLIFF